MYAGSCSGVGLQWPGARALGGGGGESSAVGVALRDCSGEPSLSEPLEFMSEPYELAERIELAVETCGEASSADSSGDGVFGET